MKIEGNKIIADEGMVLIRKSDNLFVGKQIGLGYTWYVRGKKLDTARLEVPEDYTEIEEAELDERIMISGMAWPAPEADYSVLKDYLVKVKYSPEDQIAILCNLQLNPNNATYRQKYEEMQEWRQLAGNVALEYLEKLAGG